MSQLVEILCAIVEAEHAQWMRYVYLVALGYEGSEEYEEHANNELEHAALFSRWIVDLGGTPPTTMPYVEQFCGSDEEAQEWLLQAEMDGINKYQLAFEQACGIVGLQNDISDTLSVEHEHVSDLFRMLNQKEEDDSLIVIVANQFGKNAVSMVWATNWLKSNLSPYLTEYSDNPDELKNIALELIEGSITDIWNMRYPKRDTDLNNFKDLYLMIRDATGEEWGRMVAYMFPPQQRQPEFKQMMEQIPPVPPLEVEEPEVEEPVREQRRRELEEEKARLIEEKEKLEKKERPPERVLGKVLAQDPRSKGNFYEVQVGDRIRNMDVSIPVGARGRSKAALGEVQQVLDDGTVVVLTDIGETEYWPPKHLGAYQLDLATREKVIYGRKPVELH